MRRGKEASSHLGASLRSCLQNKSSAKSASLSFILRGRADLPVCCAYAGTFFLRLIEQLLRFPAVAQQCSEPAPQRGSAPRLGIFRDLIEGAASVIEALLAEQVLDLVKPLPIGFKFLGDDDGWPPLFPAKARRTTQFERPIRDAAGFSEKASLRVKRKHVHKVSACFGIGRPLGQGCQLQRRAGRATH